MISDPMFWLPLIVWMFFLGGKYSPLSTFKWYRKFYKSIGLQINQAHRNGGLGLIYQDKREELVMVKKLARLLLNKDSFMNNIPLSWGLKIENFVYGSTEEYAYEYEDRHLSYSEFV